MHPAGINCPKDVSCRQLGWMIYTIVFNFWVTAKQKLFITQIIHLMKKFWLYINPSTVGHWPVTECNEMALMISCISFPDVHCAHLSPFSDNGGVPFPLLLWRWLDKWVSLCSPPPCCWSSPGVCLIVVSWSMTTVTPAWVMWCRTRSPCSVRFLVSFFWFHFNLLFALRPSWHVLFFLESVSGAASCLKVSHTW